MTPSSPRLLILACSRRKAGGPDLLPAIERYDGPAFRLYRRYLRSRAASPPVLQILSAELGLIACDALIPAYDRVMTGERARALRPAVREHLRRCLDRGGFGALFVNVGPEYLAALGGEEEFERLNARVRIAYGSTGRRLADLRDWLYGTQPAVPPPRVIPAAESAVLRGVRVAGDAEAVLSIARRGLVEDSAGAGRYQVWYVPVDGKRVAPKWLVSRLTGLASARFHTDEARRMLATLGVRVMRDSGETGRDAALDRPE